MYRATKSLVLRLFRVDPTPPSAPIGAHADVLVMRASPKYFTYTVLALGCSTCVLFAGLAAASIACLFSPDEWTALIPLGLAVLLAPIFALLFFCARVDYELRYYVLTDRSVRVRQGAWVVDEKTISYSNVQNVRVVQGPLQRLFGISDVKIDTAGGGAAIEGQKQGGSGHGVALAGIENAALVRERILEHVRRRAHGAGLGDVDDERRARSPWSEGTGDALRELLDAARGLRQAAESARSSAS